MTRFVAFLRAINVGGHVVKMDRLRELYWSCSVKSMDSEFSFARLERALKIQGTFRNANTVRKMAAKFAS